METTNGDKDNGHNGRWATPSTFRCKNCGVYCDNEEKLCNRCLLRRQCTSCQRRLPDTSFCYDNDHVCVVRI